MLFFAVKSVMALLWKRSNLNTGPGMYLFRSLLLLICLLALSSCSSARLAYNNLNWLINWKTSDYVPLSRTQKSWLSARIDEHLAWHCSTEIPRYRPLLAGLQNTLDTHDLPASILLEQVPQLMPAVDRVLHEIAPTLAELFRKLDHSQIAALQANLAEQQQDMHAKFVAPDPAAQAQQRAERLEKRLNRWLGRLSEEQRSRIDSWSAELEGQNTIWLENRQHWQQQLVVALNSRYEEGFTTHINDLLVERQRYWTEAFRESTKVTSRKGAAMLSDVLGMATDAQRARMDKQFEQLDRDLQRLQCAPPSQA